MRGAAGRAAEPHPAPTDPAYFARLLDAVDFAETNLHREITVEAMAKAAGLSLFYFTRVFNEATGHSPYDYLVRRRLSEAVAEVMAGSGAVPIGCIARRYCFGSAETFSRAFRRMYGLLPTEARNTGEIPRFRMRSRVSIEYMRFVNGLRIQQVMPVKVELGDLSLVGSEVWSVDWPDIAAVAALAGHSLAEAVRPSYALVDWRADGFNLFLATEATGGLEAPLRSLPVRKQVPAQECLSIRCRVGSWGGVTEAVSYATQAWLPASGSEQAGATVIVRSRDGHGMWTGGCVPNAEILVPIRDG